MPFSVYPSCIPNTFPEQYAQHCVKDKNQSPVKYDDQGLFMAVEMDFEKGTNHKKKP